MKKILFHSLFLSVFVFVRALISHESPWYHIKSQQFVLEFTFFSTKNALVFILSVFVRQTKDKTKMKNENSLNDLGICDAMQ